MVGVQGELLRTNDASRPALTRFVDQILFRSLQVLAESFLAENRIAVSDGLLMGQQLEQVASNTNVHRFTVVLRVRGLLSEKHTLLRHQD